MTETLTTAEQLTQWNTLGKWLLWKMATDSINVSRDARIQAEELFKDPSWIANVVGEFAANLTASERHTRDWDLMLDEQRAQERL